MKKKANKKGFTIMEMLIVVAIIAVLVAIAIPTFNGALEKSKEATDVANVRAAYAELQVAMLTDNASLPGDETAFKTTYVKQTLNYDDDAKKDKFTYTKDASKETATITYKAEKLDGGHTYTWTVEPADIQ